MAEKARDPFFDVLKFVAIGLVVYGHVTERFCCEVFRPYDGNFIVGMNMPLFFAISGYFARGVIEKGDWSRFCVRLRTYLWPNLSVNLLLFVLTASIVGSLCAVGGWRGAISWVVGRSWFLWSLAVIFATVFLCRRAGDGWRFYLMLAAAYSGLMLLPDVWLVSWTRAMFPNFVFGLLVLRAWPLWRRSSVGVICLTLFLVGVFVQGSIHQNGLSFYHVGSGWADILATPRLTALAILRLTNGIVGTLGVMWATDWVVRHVRWTARLAPLGTTTLGIYLLHEWMLGYIRPGGALWTSAITVAVLGVCHLIVVITRRCGWLRRWLWGEFSDNRSGAGTGKDGVNAT